MRLASLAECLVRLVEGSDRAAALVGDLVEIAQTRSRLWFGLAVLRLLVSRLWRPVVGVIAVLYSSNWLLFASSMALHGIHAQHRPPFMWTPFFDVVGAICAILSGSALYSAIRYGLGNVYTRLALAVAGLCALVTFARWFPGVLYACGAIFFALFFFSVLRVQRLWALLTAGLTVIVTFVTNYAGLFALSYYQNTILHIGLLGSRELAEHPSLNWLSLAVYFADAFVIAALCSFMHRCAHRQALRLTQPDDTLPAPHVS